MGWVDVGHEPPRQHGAPHVPTQHHSRRALRKAAAAGLGLVLALVRRCSGFRGSGFRGSGACSSDPGARPRRSGEGNRVAALDLDAVEPTR